MYQRPACGALVGVALLLLLAMPAAAQFDVNGPNAVMKINGTVPSSADPIDHDVLVTVPGTFTLSVETNANIHAGLILVASDVDPTTGNVLATPWGGSIDIGTPALPTPLGVFLVGDGIGLSTGPLSILFQSDAGNVIAGTPPTFNLTYTASAPTSGLDVAFQAVVADPTAVGGLDNTEAGDANLTAGQQLVVQTGTNGSIQVAFLPGSSFSFHGVNYTDLYVCANGFVSFGAPTSVTSSGFSNDHVSFMNAEPAIASWLADFCPTCGAGTSGDGVYYEEFGNQALIAWGHPNSSSGGGISHFQDNSLNYFELRLELEGIIPNPNAGEFRTDFLLMDTTATHDPGDGLTGHTPGGLAVVGGAADSDMHAGGSAGANVAQVEEHDATGSNATNLGYDGLGTLRAYNNMFSWTGQTLTFTPNPWVVAPGDMGYTASASAQAPDDVSGMVPSGLTTSGGQITIVGKFFGFNDNMGAGGSVIFDPAGTATPGVVLGILDGTGTLQPPLPNTPSSSPFRDGEGLVVVAPPFASTGNVDIQVNFNSGASFTLSNVAITNPNQIFTQYNSNTSFVTHALSPGQTITLYGVTYNQLFISTHGYITFASGSADFSESMPEFFAGFQSPGSPTANPGVAALWSDLNNPSSSSGQTWTVLEDTASNTTTVGFNNQVHWVSGTPAGTTTVQFGGVGPGSVVFDHTNFTAASGDTHAVIIGITDGLDSAGADSNLTDFAGTGISNALGSYTSAGAPDSFGESVPANVQPGLGMWTALDTGNGTSIPYGTWSLF